jgi:predicted MPP superfamily phosphohydrolase
MASLLSRVRKYIIIIIALLLAYTFIEPYWLKTKTYTIASPEVPASFQKTKIVFLSDIHHGPFFSVKRLRKLVEKVNRLGPDIILLGGDYVHRAPKYIAPCFRELSGLNAPLGVYGVLGNHDYWEDPELTRKCMTEAGIRLIDNRAHWVEKSGKRIKIGGVGDYYYDIQDLEPTIAGTTKEDFVILVTHNPDYVEEISTNKVDLVFAGHTHGGQVTFFGLWAPLIPSQYGQKYRTGLLSIGEMRVIVTNGIGTITPPVRFFARPQIVVAVFDYY